MQRKPGMMRMTGLLLIVLTLLLLAPGKNTAARAEDDSITTRFISLGVDAIPNPKYGGGNWSKVYLGTGKIEDSDVWLLRGLIDKDVPVLFNVLNKHETAFTSSGEPTMLLESATVQFTDLVSIAIHEREQEWAHSQINNWELNQRYINKFSAQEKDAIAPSVKADRAGEDAEEWKPNANLRSYYFEPLTGKKLFILDHLEILNPSYGFPTTLGNTTLRKKSGASTDWWIRSSGEFLDVNAMIDKNGALVGGKVPQRHGVCPALNLKLSSIVFAEWLGGGEYYKLTLRDNNIQLNLGNAKASGSMATVPYTLSGSNANTVNRFTVVYTDAAWSENSGWSTNPTFLGFQEIQPNGDGTLTFHLEDTSGNYYLVAEHGSEGNYTNYAAVPAKIKIGKTFTVPVENYEGVYNGSEHDFFQLTDEVKNTSGTTALYRTDENAEYIETKPVFRNVTDGPQKVWYKFVNSAYEDYENSMTVNITPRTATVSGITTKDREYDGTTNAEMDFSKATLTGLVEGDDVKVTGTGEFEDKNAGVDKQVTLSGLALSGAKAGNYSLQTSGSQTEARATITKKR